MVPVLSQINAVSSYIKYLLVSATLESLLLLPLSLQTNKTALFMLLVIVLFN